MRTRSERAIVLAADSVAAACARLRASSPEGWACVRSGPDPPRRPWRILFQPWLPAGRSHRTLWSSAPRHRAARSPPTGPASWPQGSDRSPRPLIRSGILPEAPVEMTMSTLALPTRVHGERLSTASAAKRAVSGSASAWSRSRRAPCGFLRGHSREGPAGEGSDQFDAGLPAVPGVTIEVRVGSPHPAVLPCAREVTRRRTAASPTASETPRCARR